MLDTLKKAWGIPDLRRKILYTLAMLFVFRLGANIPVPGVDKARVLAEMNKGGQGLLEFYNLMSGGAFKNLTLFALGITPYITASIVMNLLQIAIPSLENLAKEGESGRKKIAQYTRYLTVVLALLQSLAMSLTMFRAYIVPYNGFSVFLTTLCLTAGTAFLMFLGERINENGIGNGMSLFIFAGIVARTPQSFYQIILQIRSGSVNILSLILYLFVAILIIASVVYVTEGTRKIPVQYAKRVVGRKMYGGHSSHLPLKVNQTGVIPIIFAISILMVPITIASFMPQSGFYRWMNTYFSSHSVLYNVLYAILIVFFTYFYTAVSFNPVEIADNMKKNGGFIPGIRPGQPTESYITRTLNRLTIVGAIFLALIAIIPNIIMAFSQLKLNFGGTSLLIIVGVAIETMKQIEAQMVMRHYKGFLR
ncbi:preprotein translocase subunit SecY [Guggenheimella bovis]